MSNKFVFLESSNILSTIPQYYTFLIAFIAVWIAWIYVRRYQSDDNSDNSDFDRKFEEWKPEPLISEIPRDHPSLKPRKISSRIGKRIIVDGRDCLNLASHNYLGITENPIVEKKAIETVQKYGVGSCGPRGFYGTVDVHLQLEERLAKFMDMEEAVVYSYGFSTIASAIPAYCKRKDIVFVDEKVNFSIQKGLHASRSNIHYFKHNDPKDLENIIKSLKGINKTNSKNVEVVRKFLIVEGIYMNTGTICPLPELIAICRKYKIRIFVDESISFGTLGASGKGVTEHYNVPRHEVDMIMGSLEWAIGSIGGFCVGSSFVIEHHRLSGLGYCFSASLPPLLTSAATAALDIMDNEPKLFETLKKNCRQFDQGMKKIEYFECFSAEESPIKHLYLKKHLDHDEEKNLLREISKECFENNLAVIPAAYLKDERQCPRASLRICISANLTENEIDIALQILEKSASKILSSM